MLHCTNATKVFSATQLHDTLQIYSDHEIVILERKHIKQLECSINPSIFGVGSVVRSYLETIFVAPTRTRSQFSILLHKSTEAASVSVSIPVVLQWM